MKVIIAGSRTIEDYNEVVQAVIDSGYEISEVVSGTAIGVDRLGELWAKEHDVPIKRFPAAWKQFGKAAGYMRNVIMADYAQALILVWDGKSAGSASMLRIAKMKLMPYYARVVKNDWF